MTPEDKVKAEQRTSDIKDLIKLQQDFEDAQKRGVDLSLDTLKRRNELLILHAQYKKLDAAQMQALLDNESKPHVIMPEGDDNKAIIDAYNKIAKGPDGKYKEGYSEPTKDAKGNTTMTFPSMEEAGNFFHDQAAAGRKFTLIDENDKVLAYSDGKKMFHADGKEFNKGDQFKPGANINDFLKQQHEEENKPPSPGMGSTRT